MEPESSIIVPSSILYKHDSFRISKNLFYDWSFSEALCAFFSFLGFLLATIDYEFTFDDNRSNDNCKIKTSDFNHYQILILIFTLVSLYYLLLAIYHKFLWNQYMNHVYSGTPMKKLTFSKYLKQIKWYRWIEIFFLLIIPYPGINFDIYVPLRYNFEMHKICYKGSELAYLIMFFRLEILLRAATLFSPYEDHLARTYCRRYKVPANARFGMKCLIAQYPLYVIIASAMLALLLLASIFRVIERPMDNLTTYYYSDYLNALWFLFENMSTLGYGEYLPISDLGRVVSVFGFFIGTSLFSLMVLTMQEGVNLDIPQSKAFTKIYKSRIAAEAITAGIIFYLTKKKSGKNSLAAKEKKKKLRNKCKELKNKRIEAEEMNKGNDEAIIDMKMNVSNVELKMKKVEKVVDFMIAQVSEDIRRIEGRGL